MQDDPLIYNLAFGDEDADTGVVSDLVTTDNNDTKIVLASVANTIIDFSNYYGNNYIYAKGSTSARTRLYQIGISSLLSEISIDFEIFGLRNGVLQKFQKNMNYDSFLVKRK